MTPPATGTEPAVRARLTPDLHAPADARGALDGLVGRLGQDLVARLKLLVSELVTNSVVHTNLAEGDRVGLEVSVTDGAVRVEVTDAGQGFEPPADPVGLDGVSGRGLFLVDHVADRWGVDCNACTRVWFEIQRC